MSSQDRNVSFDHLQNCSHKKRNAVCFSELKLGTTFYHDPYTFKLLFMVYFCVTFFVYSFILLVHFLVIHSFIDTVAYQSSYMNHNFKKFCKANLYLHPQVSSEFVSNKSRILELLEAERAKAAMRLDEVRQRRAEMITPTKRRRGEGSSGVGIRKDLYKVALLLREANKISQYLKKNLVSMLVFCCCCCCFVLTSG